MLLTADAMSLQHELPLQITQQLSSAASRFESRFGRRPTLAACAPGRVNLIGEHTDYNQGFVLPMAIDRQTVVVGDLARRKQSTVWAIDLEKTLEIDLALPLAPMPGHAANYLLGVAQQFIRRGHILPNIEIAVTSTVPMGAGLSSSASVEVAFATFLEQMHGIKLNPLEKALLCQHAEHEFPGTPCGIMDMLVSVMAVEGHALLIDCRSNQFQPVRLPDSADATVLIVDTKVKHALAGSEYASRRATCEAAARELGVPSLRDATIDRLEKGRLTVDQRCKALHVISENKRTVLAAAALGSGDLRSFGNLMFASHDSLRDLFQVSCRELDVLVGAARKMRGEAVFGARMTGGGFGGCAIVLCRTPALAAVQEQLQNEFTAAFGRPCATFTAVAAGPARALPITS